MEGEFVNLLDLGDNGKDIIGEEGGYDDEGEGGGGGGDEVEEWRGEIMSTVSSRVVRFGVNVSSKPGGSGMGGKGGRRMTFWGKAWKVGKEDEVWWGGDDAWVKVVDPFQDV